MKKIKECLLPNFFQGKHSKLEVVTPTVHTLRQLLKVR